MPTIFRSALVEYPAAAMYDLVCDVNAYPEFLPWCNDAAVLEQSETHQLASVSVNKFMQQSTFSTRNELTPGQQIRMQLVDGPFRYLRGIWTFRPLAAHACKIELEVDFEFANAVAAKMISPAFNRVCDTIVNAFIQRASSRDGQARQSR